MEDFYRQVHAMDGNTVVFPEAYPPSKQQWWMPPQIPLLAAPSKMSLTALLRGAGVQRAAWRRAMFDAAPAADLCWTACSCNVHMPETGADVCSV